MKLIQEMHLDKTGQRVIDAAHHDLGTSYADMYAAYRTTKCFELALRSIIDGIESIVRSAAKAACSIIGGNYAYGAHAGTFRVNAMEAGPREAYISAGVYQELPPLEVNFQFMEEATP